MNAKNFVFQDFMHILKAQKFVVLSTIGVVVLFMFFLLTSLLDLGLPRDVIGEVFQNTLPIYALMLSFFIPFIGSDILKDESLNKILEHFFLAPISHTKLLTLRTFTFSLMGIAITLLSVFTTALIAHFFGLTSLIPNLFFMAGVTFMMMLPVTFTLSILALMIPQKYYTILQILLMITLFSILFQIAGITLFNTNLMYLFGFLITFGFGLLGLLILKSLGAKKVVEKSILAG